jgi:general secretion pathway protein G
MTKRGRSWIVSGVVAVIVLIAFAIPMYEARIQTAREEVFQGNLAALREQIQQYAQDRKGAPESLQDLIDRHYIRELPEDMTYSNATWQPDFQTTVLPSGKIGRGIVDVHSGSNSISSKGTSYHTW